MLLDLMPIDRAIQGSIGRGAHPASDEQLRQFEDYVAEIFWHLGWTWTSRQSKMCLSALSARCSIRAKVLALSFRNAQHRVSKWADLPPSQGDRRANSVLGSV